MQHYFDKELKVNTEKAKTKHDGYATHHSLPPYKHLIDETDRQNDKRASMHIDKVV